jgi:glycosyltransferase involved in cell wall biosynthesis
MADIVVNTVSLSSGALTRERNLIRELNTIEDDHQYEILCTPATGDRLDSSAEHIRLHEVPEPNGTAQRLFWENTGLPKQLRRLEPDILYFPLHISNLVGGVPKITAVRNAAPFYADVYTSVSRRERLRLWALRAATARSVNESERVVFMSNTTRDRVAEHIPEAAEKGVVIPHGVPSGFNPDVSGGGVRGRYNLPERFLLSVSNLTRYKNFLELVDGYALAQQSAEVPPLFVAGKTIDQEYEAEIRARIERHGLEGRFNLLGFVDHSDLPAIHAACEGFVFPSACENAPITVVEALASGSPIACSNLASMPELCGDAALYFDPYSPEEISKALVELCSNPSRREQLSRQAVERAEAFDWSEAARRTSELFSDVAAEGRA